MVNRIAQFASALRARDFTRAMTFAKWGMQAAVKNEDPAEITSWGRMLPRIRSLAASLGDEEVMDLLRRFAEIIDARDGGFANLEAHNKLRVDLTAMRWLSEYVLTVGSTTVDALRSVAGDEGQSTRLLRNLQRLERIGTLHTTPGQIVSSGRMKAPDPVVPAFDVYPPDKSALNSTDQRAFYERFRRAVVMGQAKVDLDGQLSYGYALISELATSPNWRTELLPVLHRLAALYPGTSLAFHALEMLRDERLLAWDYRGALEVYGELFPLELYLTLAEHLAHPRLTALTFLGWAEGARITNLAEELRLRPEIIKVVQSGLDDAHTRLGRSWVYNLWSTLSSEGAGPSRLDITDFGGAIDRDALVQARKHARSDWSWATRSSAATRSRRAPAELSAKRIAWPRVPVYAAWLRHLITAYATALLRHAENQVRTANGLPQIGEGWVSERALLHLTRRSFPCLEVVHQGRPIWLRPQSVDIWLPAHKIGVEYQGEQHSRPVEMFGGAPSFKVQQERDERKRSLFAANGARLIEVHPGYDPEMFVMRLTEMIQSPRH